MLLVVLQTQAVLGGRGHRNVDAGNAWTHPVILDRLAPAFGLLSCVFPHLMLIDSLPRCQCHSCLRCAILVLTLFFAIKIGTTCINLATIFF